MSAGSLWLRSRRAAARTSPSRWAGVWLATMGAVCALALTAGPASAAFEMVGLEASLTNQDGTPSTQAGAHPYEMTVSFRFNTTTDAKGKTVPVGSMKDVEVELPAGLIGTPNATPKCTVEELDKNECGAAAQVGRLTLYYTEGQIEPQPVYNIVPPPDVPAEFGTSLSLIDSFIDIKARTGGDYGLTASLNNITTLIPLTGGSLTLWGVPADKGHDAQRHCQESSSSCPANVPPRPLLTNPTMCQDSTTLTVRADAWQDPGNFITKSVTSHDSAGNPVGVDGCGRLSFNPTIAVTAENATADTPSGMSVDLQVPQGEETPTSLATPAMKSATITLPEGVALSLSAADGLEGCSLEAIGLKSASRSACPDASKIGSMEIETPLLSDPLKGGIYLAQPNSNPFGSLLAFYLSGESDGVLIKLAGEIHADPATGQLTTIFANSPQLPFSDLKLNFFGGPRGALAMPPTCGLATTRTIITSYGGQEGRPSFTFPILPNPNSGSCSSSLPFSPAFTAGNTSSLAGSFSPFTMTVSREDGQQSLSTIGARLPRGLLAMLSGVPLCEEPQAARGSCAPASQIGSTTVSAGAGSQPLQLSGSVFLTGPYRGAPYGLAIVVPAVKGPFDLGTIVIRARILVDEHDLHLTILADPLPQIIQGIPLRMRTVALDIDRPRFMLTPTSCSAQAITGTLGSTEGASAAVSAPFHVSGCRRLPFAPKLSASTQSKASFQGDGASLDLSFTNSVEKTSNIKAVGMELPAQLRPRLSTIQHACRAVTFAADPAACPAASRVGRVTVRTPVLRSQLIGPLYLVAHGGRAYPDLVMILQSEGIKMQLTGTLRILGKGVISTTFSGLPDVPIGLLRLDLPRGPHSMLGAIANVCTHRLTFPYAITAQNDARIARTAGVVAKGCVRPGTRRSRRKRAH